MSNLLAYRVAPSPAEKVRLTAEFERIFATVTGYKQLDDRIAKTQLKQASLLLVLERPELPLHNNPAELGARQHVANTLLALARRPPMAPKPGTPSKP